MNEEVKYMQVIAQQGVGGSARKTVTAAVHDMRMYPKNVLEYWEQQDKVFIDPNESGSNKVYKFSNEFSKWFFENVKPVLHEMQAKVSTMQDTEKAVKVFGKVQRKVTKTVENELMKRVKAYFIQKKQQGLVKKNRGWQSKRASYNMVMSIDNEFKRQIEAGAVKKEDAVKAMLQGYMHVAKEMGINTIYVAVHMDETTPHMHIVAANICKDGKALTGKLRLRKNRDWQISYSEFTDKVNEATEKELIKMGYTIHLEASHMNKTGRHMSVKELRAEYVRKIYEKMQELQRENEVLRKQVQKYDMVTAVAKEAISNTEEVIKHGQHRER